MQGLLHTSYILLFEWSLMDTDMVNLPVHASNGIKKKIWIKPYYCMCNQPTLPKVTCQERENVIGFSSITLPCTLHSKSSSPIVLRIDTFTMSYFDSQAKGKLTGWTFFCKIIFPYDLLNLHKCLFICFRFLKICTSWLLDKTWIKK